MAMEEPFKFLENHDRGIFFYFLRLSSAPIKYHSILITILYHAKTVLFHSFFLPFLLLLILGMCQGCSLHLHKILDHSCQSLSLFETKSHLHKDTNLILFKQPSLSIEFFWTHLLWRREIHICFPFFSSKKIYLLTITIDIILHGWEIIAELILVFFYIYLVSLITSQQIRILGSSS